MNTNMSTLEKTLYDALKEAGVKELTATRAAEKATEYATKDDLAHLATKADIKNLEAKMNTLQWLYGVVSIPILLAIFSQYLG